MSTELKATVGETSSAVEESKGAIPMTDTTSTSALEESKDATPTTEVKPTPAVEESKDATPATEVEPTPAVEESKDANPTTDTTSTPAVEESKAVIPADITASPPVEESKAPIPVSETEPESKVTPSSVPEKDSKAPVTTPLSKLFAELPSIIEQAEHQEIWGVELSDESHVPTTIVLEKFLRANNKDVTKAKAQLVEALAWRKKIQPLKLLENIEFDRSKFGDLGYVTTYNIDGKRKEIVTWNIYGAVKDNQATFGNIEEFIKWRSALMEISVRELNLPSATEKIPDGGIDQYRMVQVHDYLNVSFLRMPPVIRAASKETIQTFSMAYPELLKEKFFVNVPLVMGWVFTAMKVFLPAETIKKFHPLSYGSSLARELPEFGQQLPEAYGGKGEDVKAAGLTVKYASAETAETTEAVKSA